MTEDGLGAVRGEPAFESPSAVDGCARYCAREWHTVVCPARISSC